MLIEPDIESAGVEGVGDFVTSRRARLFMETCVNWKTRELPWGLPVLAICMPSPETTAMLVGKPRTATEETELPDSASYSAVMPGRNLRNSPTLPSVTSPNASAAITFFKLGAKRCSLIAMAAPSVSRPVETLKASSWTVPSARAVRPPLARSTWRSTIWPGATFTVTSCGSSPVKKTWSTVAPGGRAGMR